MQPKKLTSGRLITLIVTIFLHLETFSEVKANQADSTANWSSVKIVGGSPVECSENSSKVALLAGNQPINLSVLKSEKNQSTTTVEFEVQFMECRANKWAPMSQVKNDYIRNFKDDIGQSLSEKINYTNYRAHVLDSNGQIIQTISFNSNEIKSKFSFKVKINRRDISIDDTTKTKYVEVSLVADRTRKNPADYFFDEVNWGRYQVNLSSP